VAQQQKTLATRDLNIRQSFYPIKREIRFPFTAWEKEVQD
jgi:hypothetical protein